MLAHADGRRPADAAAERGSIVRLGARLKRLEASMPPATEPIPEWERQAWEQLMSTMSERHAAIIEDEADALYAWATTPEGSPRPQTPLYDQALRRVLDHDPLLTGPKGPLALPPEVADLYLNEPEARNTTQRCRDCSYAVPAIWEYPGRHPVASAAWRIFFPRCPLCGGPIGGWLSGSRAEQSLCAHSVPTKRPGLLLGSTNTMQPWRVRWGDGRDGWSPTMETAS